MRCLLLIVLAGVLAAAAPPADPLVVRLIADARARPPETFERTTTTVHADGATREAEVRVDRWDGKTWTLVSVDGKPPTPDAAAKWAKASAAKPAPGYYRVATFLAAPITRATDATGAVVLHLPALPAGSVDLGGDRSDGFSADATVADATGPRPWVRRFAFHAREPFRVLLVARIERFDVVNDYALDADGRPAIVRQVQDYSGSLPGQRGTVHTEISFRPLR